jgi:hypothetical protein
MKGAIVYVSSNKEAIKFEMNVLWDMVKKKGDLPIFSVTHKPMDFSPDINHTNICVGDVGVSGFNFCRQLQMAVEMAKGYDYVISCEADCFYSPDYFTLVPPNIDTVYRNTNNYVMPYKKDYFHIKSSQTAFQVAGRNHLLDRLNYLLEGQSQWNVEMKNFPKEIGKPFLEKWIIFETEYPCFTIKTGNGMRNHTASGTEKYYKLPYWGEAKDIRKKYL